MDANVLIHEPESVFAFSESEILIPYPVIEEIGSFTQLADDKGSNSRRVMRKLDELRAKNDLRKGVPLENGSTLKVLVPKRPHPALPPFVDFSRSSNRVLSIALDLLEQKGNDGSPVLVTNDAGLRVRAASLGILTEGFADGATETARGGKGIETINVPPEKMDELMANYEIRHEIKSARNNHHFLINYREPFLVRYHYRKKKLAMAENHSEGVWGITPKNPEQKAALDVLNDPAIGLVILSGKAGTGKTLLALASALHQMLKSNLYEKILISRPVVPMGKDLGYLPGNLEDKLTPWMQPIFDNLDLITSVASTTAGSTEKGDWRRWIESKLLEIEPLTYIRGRSIPNRFMIVDEAQNLTPKEVKTIVSRAGHHSKIVLTGDPFQIDNPYVDENTNGLSHLGHAMRFESLSASVHLVKGERSALAELAANLL